MSIIINALKKSDSEVTGKETNLKSFFVTIKEKNNSFMVGLIAGFAMVSVVSIILFVFLIFSFNAKERKNPNLQNISVPLERTVSVETKLDELDDIDELETIEQELGLGPDIEDEILEDELNASKNLNTIIKPVKQSVRLNVPAMDFEISPMENGLPSMIISGVVFDLEGKYVYINGLPYCEGESAQDVLITKISFLNIMVTYKGKNFEIALK